MGQPPWRASRASTPTWNAQSLWLSSSRGRNLSQGHTCRNMQYYLSKTLGKAMNYGTHIHTMEYHEAILKDWSGSVGRETRWPPCCKWKEGRRAHTFKFAWMSFKMGQLTIWGDRTFRFSFSTFWWCFNFLQGHLKVLPASSRKPFWLSDCPFPEDFYFHDALFKA